ncbi:MAG: LysM peptidoglycan-binding domain-containing protein [Rhodobacteraceae bacterium]|nr:LysM peptidoglycan-binding domain-containing protein [Paracoccaceae bacterium]
MIDVVEIQKGDTLTGLSRTHNTTVGHLAKSNGISSPNVIYAGDPMVVPSAPAPMTQAPAQPAAPSAAADGVEAGEKAAEDKADTPPDEPCEACEAAQQEQPMDPPARWRAGGDYNVHVIYADARGSAGDGMAEGSIGAGMVKMQHEGHFGESDFGGSHSMDLMNAEAEAQGGVGWGAGGARKPTLAWSENRARSFTALT